MNLNEQFSLAVRHVQGRQFDEAERICRAIVAVDPNFVDALHCLGMLAAEAGRFEETVELLGQVLAKNDRIPHCHYNIALAHERLGALGEATTHYRRALALNPNYPQALANLGGILWKNGETQAALDAVTRSLVLQELPNAKALYAKLVPLHWDAAARHPALLARAIVGVWARPMNFAAAASFAVMSDSNIRGLITRATKAWPQRPPIAEMVVAATSRWLTGHALLRALLENTPVASIELERFLTVMRSALLEMASSDSAPPPNSDAMRFFCALARQCFINDYLFSTTHAEIEKAQNLRARLSAALQRGGVVPALWPVAVAAYFPLHSVAHGQALLSQPGTDAPRAVLLQQIAEPLQERSFRDTFPALTAIKDSVSLKVRGQYEEHPYPCWVKIPQPYQLGQDSAVTPYHVAPRRDLQTVEDVLIAGCGTGQQPLETALDHPRARFLAVDLSRVSMAYAQRKAVELGIKNIEFAQADIMELGSIGRTFDLIECTGVLHHLGDPWAGWEMLLPLLRPDGLMRIGLYSKLARRHVNEARRFIAAGGYGSTSDDIRICRQHLLARGNDAMVRNLSSIGDFYNISACRDLLFHVQEHQMSLSEIKAFLADHALQFLGFELDPQTLQRFRTRHAGPEAMTDLDLWQSFETEFPDTFLGMYLFGVQRERIETQHKAIPGSTIG